MIRSIFRCVYFRSNRFHKELSSNLSASIEDSSINLFSFCVCFDDKNLDEIECYLKKMMIIIFRVLDDIDFVNPAIAFVQ